MTNKYLSERRFRLLRPGCCVREWDGSECLIISPWMHTFGSEASDGHFHVCRRYKSGEIDYGLLFYHRYMYRIPIHEKLRKVAAYMAKGLEKCLQGSKIISTVVDQGEEER